MIKHFLFCLCLTLPLAAQERLSSTQLLEDFEILKSTLLQLHPGLYRYADSLTIEGYCTDFERRLQQELSLKEAYLEYSKFLAKLKDGHTYANFWNQSTLIKTTLFEQADKLPFTFEWIDGRMVVLDDGSAEALLSAGTEVLDINGIAVSDILDSLLLVARGDGNNRSQRIYEMQLSGIGMYEAFDIYFPLYFPPNDNQYLIGMRTDSGSMRREIQLQTTSRSARSQAVNKRYGRTELSYDDLWQLEFLDEQTAYLRLGTFVTWKMELNWRKFLKSAFAEIHRRNISNLIVDIRGNGGGLTKVYLKLLSYLSQEKVKTPPVQALMRYERVPDNLRPYLNTWNTAMYDRSRKVRPLGNGFYERKGKAQKAIRSRLKAFQGSLYLLVDAANSSATFSLAKTVQAEQLGVLVGQTTGGNLKGITGGELFFLSLPNSGIEVDIPLIAGFPQQEQPDAGIEPDVRITRSMEALRAERDLEMEWVLQDIAQKNSTKK